jgi:outer membrane receptor protein involved in Fe transport
MKHLATHKTSRHKAVTQGPKCGPLPVAPLLVFSALAVLLPHAEVLAQADASAERIVVTGSRVVRAGFDTLEPATVVTRERMEQQGLTNVADALRVPGFSAGVTPESGQSSFGVGLNFVNRLGLGSSRTLTLINGRRVVSSNTPSIFGPASPGLQVDLNIVPVQMVERVENLTIGGAPTYGADAIAGVVNVITRRSFKGFEVNATAGQTDRSDGARTNFGALWGQSFAGNRGNVMVAYSFDRQDGVLESARPYFAQNISANANPCINGPSSIATTQPNRTPANDGRVDPNSPFQTCLPSSAADGLPNSVFIYNTRIFGHTAGGILYPATGAFKLPDNRLRGFGPAQSVYLQFNPSGQVVPYNPGFTFGTQNASGGDGFNLVDTRQLTSELVRNTVNLNATYQLGQGSELFFESIFYNSKALELRDQQGYNAELFGGLSAPITFPSNYAQLSDAARATLAANSITAFRLSRNLRDVQMNNGRGENTLMRAVAGIRGEFKLGKREFQWEASAVQGENKSTFFGEALNQQNFINALNVAADSTGKVVCTTSPVAGLVIPGGGTPKADPNCVPLSLFGEGAPSAPARAYVLARTQATSKIEQQIFNANISGSLFDLPAGSVDFNAGVETRREAGNFVPDEFLSQGLGRAVAILGNSGSYRTKEVFGEVVLPVLNAKMVNDQGQSINRLDLTGKFRRVDNEINGVANTHTIGFQFRPVRFIELRGNETQAIRAPSVTELFTPVSNIFTTVPDPCDSRNAAGGTRPDTRKANCQQLYNAFGINGSTFISTAVQATIPGTLSGNNKLLNEKSKARNLGLVLQVTSNLRMSVDRFEIDISDTIANLNATSIATGCFDNFVYPNPFCDRIVRDATGQITGISTGFVNGGVLKYRGGAVEAVYTGKLPASLPPALAGAQASLGMSVASLQTYETSTNRVVTDFSAGTVGLSKRQAQIQASLAKNGIGLSLTGSYVGRAFISNNESAEARDIINLANPYGSYTIWSAGASYAVNKSMTVRLAVSNLTDKNPPFPMSSGAASGTYDLLGRRYALSVSGRF